MSHGSKNARRLEEEHTGYWRLPSARPAGQHAHTAGGQGGVDGVEDSRHDDRPAIERGAESLRLYFVNRTLDALRYLIGVEHDWVIVVWVGITMVGLRISRESKTDFSVHRFAETYRSIHPRDFCSGAWSRRLFSQQRVQPQIPVECVRIQQ